MDEYIVRLLIRVEADSEKEAVDSYIQQLNNFGLRSWVYVVENARTRDLYEVTGVGEVKKVDPQAFVQR